jgi:hypothetical protein
MLFIQDAEYPRAASKVCGKVTQKNQTILRMVNIGL